MAIVLKEEPEKLTEKRVQTLLAYRFDYYRQKIMLPNIHFFWEWESDLILVTPADLLWEFEIKLNLADWKADEKKKKWKSEGRKFVSRFFYVVPEPLIKNVPDFVDSRFGLIAIVHHAHGGYWVKTVRKAGKLGNEKLPQVEINRLFMKMNCRYWRDK